MQIIGVARLGRDAELRNLPDGTPVANLALAFNYGRKGADGNKPTQWLDAALWGKVAEALAPYLLKGQQVCVTVDDPHIETYPSPSGERHKLVGRVLSIELVGSRPQGQEAAPRRFADPGQATPQRRAPAPAPAADFSDMDDDIPF
jgi:single-strand DNA-binding protein